MKTLKKILIGLLIFIVLVAVAGVIVVGKISRRALPEYSGNFLLPGLREQVIVYRDHQGMPHIFASNEEDLYMTTGYLMAQDRLWQMDLLRRVTYGRLSEIFGEDMIGADHLLRALRIPEKSQMILDASDESLLLHLEAFSKGVNSYLEILKGKLPPEFTILGYKPEPWQPLHTVNLIGYMAWDLAGSWQNEIVLHKLRQVLDDEKFMQLIPDIETQHSFAHPSPKSELSENDFYLLDYNSKLAGLGIDIFSASNNWAVSPAKSETGHAILANDMHLGFGSPGIWYQVHQVVRGQFNVSGVALPGAPFVIVGRNDHIAWGMTNLYVDEMDFYIETIHPDNPNKYLFNGEWLDMEVRDEVIHVKKDTVMRQIRFTHRGPVISGYKKIDDQVISMRWTGNEFSNELRSIYLLNKAQNWDDFRDALSTFGAVSQNVNYADVEGNIGLQTAGAVPVRKNGNGMFLYPGETDEYDWIGMIPFDELPFTYNPPEGFVASANNRTTGDDYPYTIGHWFDISARNDRIRELLEAKEKHSPADFMIMLGDVKSKLSERYIYDLLRILSEEKNLTATEQAALAALASWDLNYHPESAAPAIYEQFYTTFARNLLQDEMGEDIYKEFGGGLIRHFIDYVWRNPQSSWVNNINTDAAESFEDIVLISFRESVEWLSKEMGKNPDEWQWGKIHQITIKHPMGSVAILDRIFKLNRGPFPVGGSFHTVNPMAWRFHGNYDVVHGASQRHIWNMGNPTESWIVIPTGISGIPASPYYCSQIEMFLNNQYKQMRWRQAEVAPWARYTAVFSNE